MGGCGGSLGSQVSTRTGRSEEHCDCQMSSLKTGIGSCEWTRNARADLEIVGGESGSSAENWQWGCGELRISGPSKEKMGP